MAFLAIDSQRNLFTLQKSQLEFEQMLLMNQVNWLQKEMAYVQGVYDQEENSDASIDEDPYYMALQDQEEYLTSRTEALESQVNTLNEEISSAKQQVQNNIKSSCGLNLIGG